MRVLQLIDSLRSGGAEKMSVSYANALAKRIDGSFLCCTRMEGLLKKQLTPEVGYLFLNKKRTLDLQAFLKLRKFIKENKIDFIQAHSSSWFLALLVKMSLPKLKLVWHDHYGQELQTRKSGILKVASGFFEGIVAVNENLRVWSEKNLRCKNVRFIPNFLPYIKESNVSPSATPLQGDPNYFKIICLANLRPQKDHFTLLNAFKIILEQNIRVSLHLVGKDLKDPYSKQVKHFITQHELEGKVFLYGEQEKIEPFLEHADLGILSSASEGLPVSLLEYANAELPVLCTDVGECSAVIGEYGKLVPPHNPEAMSNALNHYLVNNDLLRKNGRELKKKVRDQFSEEVILPQVLQFFSAISLKYLD